MISKKLAIKLITEWAPVLIEALDIKKATINMHTDNSESKKLRKKTGDRFNDLCGCCWSSKINTHDIIIFYDKHHSKKKFVGTILHELLHVKMSALSGLVTLKEEIAYRTEETIVSDLENMIINLIEV